MMARMRGFEGLSGINDIPVPIRAGPVATYTAIIKIIRMSRTSG